VRKTGLPAAARLTARTLAAAALVVAGACSAIKLTYNNLDWIALWQVGRFVDLDPPQKALFDERFGEFLSWHRSTQLQLYVHDIRELAARVDKPLTAPQVEDYFTRSREHLARALREAVPDTAKVLRTLDDEQAAELVANLRKKRDDRRKESAEMSQEEIREMAVDDTVKYLKRWIGPLTRDEKARVRKWADERQYAGTLWYQYQEAWGSAFTEVLTHRHDDGFEARLGVLFHDAKVPSGDAMAKIQDHNRRKWIEMLADISGQLTPEQRQHARSKLQDLAADLEELASQAVKRQ
jgi:hypothetical protein